MFSRGGIFAGCASARVWHKSGSISPTTQKEVDIALSECEYRTEVATARSRCQTWTNACVGTCLIPFVGLGFCIASTSPCNRYKFELGMGIKKEGVARTIEVGVVGNLYDEAYFVLEEEE